MKPIAPNEIFRNLSGFLKTRGIELKEGSYAQGIQKSCSLLTNAINLGQESMERAKGEFDKSVEHMRKVIHEKTAPKTPPVIVTAAPPKAQPKPAQEPKAASKRPKAKAGPQSKRRSPRQ